MRRSSAHPGIGIDGFNVPWQRMILDIGDALCDESLSPRDMLVAISLVIQKYYPPSRFRFSAYLVHGRDRFEIVSQWGYPVTTEELERIFFENRKAMRAYELTRSARFINSYEEAYEFALGNIFDEGATCFIPLMTSTEIYGWMTISAVSKDRTWYDDEISWLPVVGSLCGSFLRRSTYVKRMVNEGVRRAEAEIFSGIRNAIGSIEERSLADLEGREIDYGPLAQSANDGEALSKLTDRERIVLAEMAAGLTNNEISQKLLISTHTTKKHVENILYKLGAKNRLQATKIFERYGSQSSHL